MIHVVVVRVLGRMLLMRPDHRYVCICIFKVASLPDIFIARVPRPLIHE